MEIALSIIGGLVALAVGGEFLVRGAVQIAERLGVSPLLIGLTLVGFGTSTPELVTSVQAALIGAPGIAVGNIVGSNIANVLLILGLSAMIFPVAVTRNALRRDGTLVLVTALALTAVGLFGTLDRIVGFVFVAGLAAYIVYAYMTERTDGADTTAAAAKAAAYDATHESVHGMAAADPKTGMQGILVSIAFALGGLAIVVVGGGYLVDGAVQLAKTLGISDAVIGLTIVAVGTSMPEFVTSVVAAIRKQSDVALGNILGSNIYNILGIGGVTGLIAPTAIPAQIATFDNFVMVAVSVALLAFAWSGMRLARWEGAVLLAGYVAYVAWLWPR
jgi:cation:H+ antiporter